MTVRDDGPSNGAGETATKTRRNARIDFVRGIAIVLVLVLHFALAYRLAHCPLTPLIGRDWTAALFYNGNYGVTAFFVVSGYLITSISLDRWHTLRGIDAPAFYGLRVARIFPPLLLALAVIVLLGCLGLPYFSNADGGHHLPASYFVVAVGSILTFWHNVLMQSAGWFNYCLNIYWSLSVEEVFYLTLPIAGIALRRQGLFVVLCAALLVYGPIYRFEHASDELFWECGYFACFDAIALGCLTALAARRWPVRGRPARGLRIGSCMGFAAVYLWGIDGHEIFGFSLIALCTALYLLASVNDSAQGPATGRLLQPLRWMGRHSYELYLFHIIVLALMRNLIDREQLPPVAWLPWLALFMAASAFVAQLVARRVADPANAAVRRRLYRWRSVSIAAARASGPSR